MTFPINPTDGQTANVNGITYTYSSSRTAWQVSTAFTNNITASTATLTGNIIAGNANVTANTAATSTTTGALRVAGGAGIAGNIYANAYYYANGTAVGGGGATGNVFSNVTAGGVTVSANSTGNLNLVGSGTVSLSSNNTTKTITITGSSSSTNSYGYIYASHANGAYAYTNTAYTAGSSIYLKEGNNITFSTDGSNLIISSSGGGGGGGTLAIGNAVYLMWYNFSAYYLARGWVYKSDKQTNPAYSTMYFRFYDYYSTPSINPSWSTVKDAPSPSTWSFQGSSPSASSFASTVATYPLYGLEFYSDYNFAGSEMIMPMSPSSTSATPAATLKYPSGGLSYGAEYVYSGYDGMTNPTWGYAPNYYVYFSYILDGTQDSKIASFNYP